MPNRRRFLSLLPHAAILAAGPAGLGARAGGSRLVLGGTGMALAAMQQVGQGFVAQRPGLAFEVKPSLGTAGGLAAVAAGAIDFALLARPLTEAERGRGLGAVAYAATPIAFVTHAENPATGVTWADIARILTGEMPAWPDGTPLRLVRREPSDADWGLLRRLSSDMAQAVETALRRPGLLSVGTDQENAISLQRLRGSFGMVSIGQLTAEALRLKPLALEGIMPDLAAPAGRRYPLSRTLHIAWSAPPAGLLASFLDHLASGEAQALLGRLGHAPPSAA